MSVFQPLGPTVSITVGATTANILVDGDGGSSTVRVMNNGSATVWIELGGSSVAAVAASSIPIGPGRDAVFAFTGSHAAAIAAGTTGLVYFTPGAGGE